FPSFSHGPRAVHDSLPFPTRRSSDLDRFFRENMQAALGRGNTLGGVQPGRAADGNQIHRTVSEERVEVLIRFSAMRAAESTDLLDRKSTRLNSSHEWISYAVFCLKKK